MINRRKIKQAGRTAFLSSFWKCVAAALILGLAIGGNNGPSGANFGYNEVNYGSQSASGNLSAVFSPAILLSLLLGFLIVLLIGVLISIFLLQPLGAGAKRFFLLNREHGRDTNFGELLYAFNNSYLNIVKTLFLQNLLIGLWSLLFVIPGIVKSYSYRMVPYILAEKPDLNWRDALSYSQEMMDGRKWDCFVYDLSYIGWFIVSALTLGIAGLFYVDPYKACSDAELYTVIRDAHFNRPHIYPGENQYGTGNNGTGGIWQ